jgi:isopentenyl diphosphate isomerase/L-lactate dehydrogenase-like FMN-dependent dehydrogenase
VLVDTASVDPSVTILGRPAGLPVGIAPAALHAMAHPEAEKATGRAAAAAGAVNVVSTMASHTIEEVARAAPGGRRWFQLYVQRNRTLSREFVQRAEAAGYEAICLTVDLPVLGYRDEVVRRGFDPGEDAYANIPKRDVWRGSGDMDVDLDTRSVGLTWDDLAEIRSWSSLPLVLKGILTAEDAALAVEHGVDGIWVSNHGGRQLDRTFAAIDVLDEIVVAVGGRAEVYLDGGVRRGPEVLIALALGATAVFTARPFLYALASAGEAGVARAFAVLREDLERSMALLGVARLEDVRREHVGTVSSGR